MGLKSTMSKTTKREGCEKWQCIIGDERDAKKTMQDGEGMQRDNEVWQQYACVQPFRGKEGK